MRNLSIKHKIYIIYFIVSWLPLSINDDTPLWIILLVVLNFGNAARLIKQVPFKDVE